MEINNGDVMPSEVESIKSICIGKGIEDPGLVMDVFRVISMNGKTKFLSDEDILSEVSRTDPKFWERKVQINTRKDFLESLAESNYVKALINMDSPMKAITVFIEHLEQAAAARAEALNKRRPIQGIRYNCVDKGYSREEIEELRPLVEQARAEEESFDAFVATLTHYDVLTESEEVSAFMSGCGVGTSYSATNFGGDLAKDVVQKGENLPKDYPILYNEFQRIAAQLGAGNLVDVDSPDEQERKKKDRMDDFSQVDSVDPMEMAREEFDINLSQKKLEVNHNITVESGTCHLFVMLDVSGSMHGCDVGGLVCRAFAANILSLSLLQFAVKDNWHVHVAPFTSRVGERSVQNATDRDTALAAMKWLGGQNYNGWDTDIENAVIWAYGKLQTDPTYRKCDIVLITDGFSPMSQRMVDLKPAKTKLHTLMLGDECVELGPCLTSLKDASDSFYHVGWDANKQQLDIGVGLNNINRPDSND